MSTQGADELIAKIELHFAQEQLAELEAKIRALREQLAQIRDGIEAVLSRVSDAP